jgi:hypothetical protein
MLLNKTQDKIYNFFVGTTLVAVVSFGFFVSVLSFYLGFVEEDVTLSSYNRVLIFFICIICIFISFKTGAYEMFLTKNTVFLLFVYLYYGLIIYHDLYLDTHSNVSFLDNEKNAIMQRILRLVFMPMLALVLFRRKNLDLVFWAQIISFVLFFSLVASLSVLQLNLGDSVDERAEISQDLNSLNIGYTGAIELLLIIFLMTKSNKLLKLFYLFIGLPFSLYVILIAGSRGPLFYSIFIGLYYLFIIDDFKKYRKAISSMMIIIVGLLILNYSLIFDFIKRFNPFFVERIEDALFKGDTSGREWIYITAMEQFFKNPFFGDYFVLTSGEFKGGYPHNILIEALMAIGIIGAVPLFILMIKTFVRVKYIIRNNEDNTWIAIIFLISFLKGLSTWNLYGNELLWISMFIILTYNVQELKKKNHKVIDSIYILISFISLLFIKTFVFLVLPLKEWVSYTC